MGVRRLLLSDLLDRRVVTDGGRSLGRAYDVRARREPGGALVLDGLVLGQRGLLERYGLRRLAPREPALVPWSAVLDPDGPGWTIVVAEAALGG